MPSQGIGSVGGPPFTSWDVSRKEVLRRAELVKGRTLRAFLPWVPELTNQGAADKGKLGKAMERFLGRPSFVRGEPDFPKAGLDLKVVPLIQRPRAGLQVKEFTYVSTPAPATLAREE